MTNQDLILALYIDLAVYIIISDLFYFLLFIILYFSRILFNQILRFFIEMHTTAVATNPKMFVFIRENHAVDLPEIAGTDARRVGRRSVTINYNAPVRQCVCADRWSCAHDRSCNVSLVSTPSLEAWVTLRDSAHNRTFGHARIVPDCRGGRADAATWPASYFRTCGAHGAPRCLAVRDTCTSLCRLSLRSSPRKVTRISASHLSIYSDL